MLLGSNLSREMPRVDFEDRRLMTEAGRRAFKKSFEYEIVSLYSEMSQWIQEKNKLRRPGM